LNKLNCSLIPVFVVVVDRMCVDDIEHQSVGYSFDDKPMNMHIDCFVLDSRRPSCCSMEENNCPMMAKASLTVLAKEPQLCHLHSTLSLAS
jgi:hypothetical protein